MMLQAIEYYHDAVPGKRAKYFTGEVCVGQGVHLHRERHVPYENQERLKNTPFRYTVRGTCDGTCLRRNWGLINLREMIAETAAKVAAAQSEDYSIGLSPEAEELIQTDVFGAQVRVSSGSRMFNYEYCIDRKVHLYEQHDYECGINDWWFSAGPCDGSCQPRIVTLSRAAERVLERFQARTSNEAYHDMICREYYGDERWEQLCTAGNNN